LPWRHGWFAKNCFDARRQVGDGIGHVNNRIVQAVEGLKTRENEVRSQGVRIVGAYGVSGRSRLRVGWVCVVVSCGVGVVAALSSAMVAVCSSIVVVCKVVVFCKVVVGVSSSSMVGIICVGAVIGRVGSSSGQGVVSLVVGGMQHVGGSLHDGETTGRKSTITVVVLIVCVIAAVSALLQGGRGGFGKTKLLHILQMSSCSCWSCW